MNVNISERLYAIRILNDFKGGLDVLATILEDIKQFVITDEEWLKAERVVEGDDESKTWRWDDVKGGDKEVTLQNDTLKYLKKTIDDKNDKGEFGLADKAVISLRKKLG